MKTTGQSGKEKILLVVCLTAFSSAMKELNQLKQFTLDASGLVAQWSAKFTPVEVPQTTEIQHTTVKVKTCEIKQSRPSIELPWLAQNTQPRAIAPRPSQVIDFKKEPAPAHIAKLKKLPQFDFDPVQLEVRIPSHDGPELDIVVPSEPPLTMFKPRTRKPGAIRLTPRDREILLKTLNRSINLRFAS
jgi:hypothetical protein